MTESLTTLSQLCGTYTILYAEDDSNTQEEVARTLRRIFKEVYLAHDGAHGLELFKKHSPNIVITDIQMPKKNGLEMSKSIKELSATTPIIITTAFNDEHFFIKAIEVGVDTFLLKPIDKQKLYEALLKTVGQLDYIEQTKELARLKMVEEINHVSEESVKSLANLFPFPTLFYQNDRLIFINTMASETLSPSQVTHFSRESDFITAFDIKKSNKQKIKLPTTQGLHKIFWVYPNALYIGSNESLVQAYIFVDITLLEYQKLKLSNYALFMHGVKPFDKESRIFEKAPLACPLPEISKPSSIAPSLKSDDFLNDSDKIILRKMHAYKISAKEYLEELGDDCYFELEELRDTKDELQNLIYLLQEKKDSNILQAISELMLSYAAAMEALFEFKDLGYALRNIARLIVEIDTEQNPSYLPKLSIFLSSIADDLSSWYYNIFVQQNVVDIHYLDSSLLSSCLQMETTFNGSYEDTLGDDLELF